jgi:uncharacterized membrane protein YqaE (UPF0057 family)
MKRALKIIVLSAFLLPVLFTSCSTSLEVSKRKHRKGYHVNWVKAPKVNQEQSLVQNEVLETEVKAVQKEADELQELSSSAESREIFIVQNNEKKVDASKADDIQQTTTSALSQKERLKSFRKEIKKLRKNASNAKDVNDDDVRTILIIVLCFLLPPLAVYLMSGLGDKFWISVLLTLLFWIPGVVYAILVYLDEV